MSWWPSSPSLKLCSAPSFHFSSSPSTSSSQLCRAQQVRKIVSSAFCPFKRIPVLSILNQSFKILNVHSTSFWIDSSHCENRISCRLHVWLIGASEGPICNPFRFVLTTNTNFSTYLFIVTAPAGKLTSLVNLPMESTSSIITTLKSWLTHTERLGCSNQSVCFMSRAADAGTAFTSTLFISACMDHGMPLHDRYCGIHLKFSRQMRKNASVQPTWESVHFYFASSSQIHLVCQMDFTKMRKIIAASVHHASSILEELVEKSHFASAQKP